MLDDKIILVTGGNGLLGKAYLKDIREKRGTAINLDIDQNTNLDEGNIFCDITDDESIKTTIETVLGRYGRIDGLVNNAYPRTKDWGNRFEEVSTESFSKNVDMQLSRIFAISKPILEIMKRQRQGAIVNIASIYGMVGNDFTVYENTMLTSPPAYAAIKGGVINFNRYIASYFGKYNVRSNCISPGGIFDNQNGTFVKQYEHKVPMKRMGQPKDIAPAVSFLLSNESRYITGQNIAVDGGWTCI